MTTGRINQVTILRLSTKYPNRPPKRRILPSKERQSAPSCYFEGARSADSVKQPIQLPPLSFPRDSPQRKITNRKLLHYFRYIYPSGGENLRLDTHEMRKLDEVIPQDLVNVWYNQQSTDPKRCPTGKCKGVYSS